MPSSDSARAQAPAPERHPRALRLDEVAGHRVVEVVAVDGDDDLARRLVSVGLWPGVLVERIATAPFGDPMLFRLHGYRLALRRAEAARVLVAERAG